MLKQILSPDTGVVLHEVYRRIDLAAQGLERIDLGSVSNFLQVAAMRVEKPKTYRAHTHLERERNIGNLRAQECWVIIQGSVIVHYFDEHDNKICDEILESGDLTVTYFGGHGYTVLSPETLVYEFKSGPYEGQLIDKRFIAES